MLKGGKHGPAIVPGKADESLLFKMAAHRVEPVMPPKDKKEQKPLTPGRARADQALDRRGREGRFGGGRRGRRSPWSSGTLPPGVHPIVAVDMTADGKRVAAGRANVVQVYDVDSGLQIASLGGHKDIIQSLRFSPDGRGWRRDRYQIVTLWNLPTEWRRRRPCRATTAPVRAVVAIRRRQDRCSRPANDRSIRVWDVAQGKEIREGRNGPAGSAPGALARWQDAGGRRIGRHDSPGQRRGREGEAGF